MAIRRLLSAGLLFALLVPGTARADGLFVPFLGVNFAGNSGSELSDAIDAERLDWGASLGYMGAGVLGVEVDAGYSADFFGRSDVGGSSVLTLMGNLLIGIPIGGQTGVGFRPYVLAGLGVIRSEVDAAADRPTVERNEFAWNFGGGAMFFFGSHVGLRADLRYFRSFGDFDFDVLDVLRRSERLDFSRASAGFILRF